MGLALSSRDTARLERVLRTLVSPLDYESPAAWSQAVLSDLRALFRAPRGMFTLPLRRELVFWGQGIDPEIFEPFKNYLVRPDPRGNEYADPLLQRAMSRLVAARVEVWNEDIATRITRIPLPSIGGFYHDVLKPGKLENMWVAGALGPGGHALLGVFHDRTEDNPFGEGSLELLRLILPALRSGLYSLDSLHERAGVLESALDAVDEALLLCDREGRELHRNRSLRLLLEADPDREPLERGLGTYAGKLSRLRRGRGRWRDDGDGRAVGGGRLETRGGSYALRGTYLSGAHEAGPAILIAVQAAGPLLPDGRTLRERFGLTPRQAEVALLLARGRSNREIAERLSLSPHTVRHHAQRVLEKLGVHSRKALALTLLESS